MDDFTPSTLAAWLFIGPTEQPADESAPFIGVQRLHKADGPACFVRSHLATALSSAVYAATGNAELSERMRERVLNGERGNFDLDLGNGMTASVFPADPKSGVNYYRGEEY